MSEEDRKQRGCLKQTGIVFIVISLLLASCEYGRKVILAITYPLSDSNYIQFPLGKGSITTFKINSIIPHRYCMYMRTNFINGKYLYLQNIKNEEIRASEKEKQRKQYEFLGLWKHTPPAPVFILKVDIYRLSKEKKVLFENREVDNFYGVGTHGSEPDTPDDEAYNVSFFCTLLPFGKYEFVVTDKSVYIPFFDKVSTSLAVHPDTAVIY